MRNASLGLLLSEGVNSGGAVSFNAVATPSNVSANGTGTLTTQSTTVKVTGGVPAYTYAWSQLNGGAITIVAPAAQTTAFTATPGAGATIAGTFQCVVTDSTAATATTEAVSAIFINTS